MIVLMHLKKESLWGRSSQHLMDYRRRLIRLDRQLSTTKVTALLHLSLSVERVENCVTARVKNRELVQAFIKCC